MKVNLKAVKLYLLYKNKNQAKNQGLHSECSNHDFWYQVYCNRTQPGAAVERKKDEIYAKNLVT